KIMAEGIKIVVDILTTLISWVQKALDWIGQLLGKLGPLNDVANPMGGLRPGGNAAAVSGRAFGAFPTRGLGVGALSADLGGGARAGGGVNVFVYGGDPRRVTAAVREGYRRWTG